MTITLTQLTDLQRVQVALSGLPDGSVQVQRVINPAATEALWARGVVRGGLALPVVGGVGNLDDFEFPADVANHYRVVPVDPPAGLLLDGTVGGYASTPDNAALVITGDLDVRGIARLADWTGAGSQTIAAQYTRGGNQRSWLLAVLPSGAPQLIWSANGTAFTQDSSTIPLTPDPVTGELAVRVNVNVDAGGGNRQVTFRTAPSMAGPWALHEQLTVAGVAAFFNSSAPLTVGADEGGTLNIATGSVLAVEVRNGIDGTVVANPDFAAQANGATGFTDAAGRVWTVNGTAEVVGAVLEQASITPSLAGRVWLKSIRYPALNRPVVTTEFDDPARASRDTITEIAGRSVPVAQNELRASPEFTLELQTATAEQAGELDIILAAGGTMFVHTPASCPIPGGYVQIRDTGQARRTRSARSARRYFTLPCRVVAAPAPQVTGTLLTAETVFRLYGDANALYAAHATGRSLLATIADPSDLVVI